MMTIRRYSPGSADYERALNLRRKVLREPLGLTYSPTDLEPDENDLHLGLFESEQCIGTLTLTRQESKMKMRQVAVDPNRQGEGIGRALVLAAEELAASEGATEMVLHARESAKPFYERLGYVASGEPFIEVTLSHWFMAKPLRGPNGSGAEPTTTVNE